MLKRVLNNIKYDLGRIFVEAGICMVYINLAMEKKGSAMVNDIGYLNPFSRHMTIRPLYSIVPQFAGSTFIAPNATLIGDVQVGEGTQIFYNCSVKGDKGAVRIGDNCTIGDFTVLSNSDIMPTTIPQATIIGSGCTLTSNIIDDGSVVGDNATLLEGARMERGSVLGPNSTLSQAVVIPSGQYWTGTPATYVRDLKEGEIAKIVAGGSIN